MAAGLVALRGVEGRASGALDVLAGGAPPAPARGARRRAAGSGRGDRLPGVRAVPLLPAMDATQVRGEPPRDLHPRRRADLSSRTTARTCGRGRSCSFSIPPGCRRRWRAFRPTPSARRASSGAIRSTAGTRWSGTASRWWIARLRQATSVADVARIDHFRGFAAGWSVPASETSAIAGRWIPGPGLKLFDAVRRALGDVPLVAEDLGVITDDVRELLAALGIPGMKVLQFGFSEDDSEHLPHRHVANAVVYTGRTTTTRPGAGSRRSPKKRDAACSTTSAATGATSSAT